MSRETESALTPEEWRLRGFSVDTHRLDRPEHWDDDYPSPALFLTADGTLCQDDGGVYRTGIALDACKVMALANLSLTLEQKPGAVTYADVEVCVSAAWYFRKLARELIKTAESTKGEAERASFLAHAASLTGGNMTLFKLSETLRALVPPG